MTEHGLERLQHLFEAALTCLPEERVAFLDHACDGNSDLKAQVLRLLAVHEQESSFFDKPLGHLVPDVLADLVAGSEGRYVGAYHLKRRIGYGGMGAVYLAERADGQFEKQVAVKLIQTVRSGDLLRRFLSERQILASLEHPHIARLLDGGMTEEGQPYLVMEYVDGQSISEFCDSQQWGVPERLWLFLDVCEAVHYAHQNLIVHRDLKPSNILVTEDGTVKLLDFGIAKLLDPQGGVQAGLTQTTTRLMTPAYASPEQVRGEAITTASDVYQLGVLLYELLAGHNPHHTKRALLHEIEQAICELEPEKPSTAILHTAERGTAEGTVAAVTPESISRQRGETLQQLRRRLRGDLDTIALMALRKEPSRRYASTEQLAEDVRRYLEGRPVRAQGDALSYRAHKFVQRNKAAVFGAGLAVLAMILGMIGTTWQAAVAEQERARAEQRFEDVRELAGAFIFDVHDAIAPLAGSTRARQLVVEKALTYLDRLAQEEVDDPDLQRELANAYLKIGDIQGKPYTANLGDLTGAFESYEKARGILEALTTSEPSKMEAQHDLGRAYLSLGNVLHIRLGNMKEGGMYYLRALAVLDSLVAQDSTNLALWYDWTEANVKVGNYWEWNGGDQSKELAQYQKAERVLSRLLEKYPADEGLQESWALTHALQGWGMERAAHVFDAFFGDRERAAASYRIAREHFQRVLAVREPRLRADVANAEAQYAVAEVHGKIAEQAVHLGKVEEAFVHHFAPALTLLEQLWLSDPANAEAGILLSFTYLRIGNALMQQGRVSEARTQYRRALTTMEALQANGKMNDEARFDWAMTLEQMGEVLVMAREKDEALEYYRQALELRKGLAQRNSSFAGYHKDVYYTIRRLVGLLVDNGQKSEATQLMSNHLTILKTRADSPTAQASEMELYALALLTCEPSHLRQPSRALAYLTRAAAHYEKKTPRFLGNLALAQYLNGDIIQARETMLQGLALLPPVDASGPVNLDANFARLLRSLDTPMVR